MVKSNNALISELVICDRDGIDHRIVFETADHIEAPNWTTDGNSLIFNSDGKLFSLLIDGATLPVLIGTGPIDNINNDHCLSPDGRVVFFSANDGHLYAVPIEGGLPSKISNDKTSERQFHHYLHGVSPDGLLLVYVGLEKTKSGDTITNIYTLPAGGGQDRQLTDVSYPVDGPEFSPDGQWIYFNSEHAAEIPGHAQIYRMRPDGAGGEQLTTDNRVNWFPHLSPDGKWVAFISFPEGTLGHPSNKEVILKVMSAEGTNPRDLDCFNGGQGTINVNSWSPDSHHLAYVRYRRQTDR